ncbi:hypothetical protein B0T10DRAFT_91863 [Thelonectria olida]|uniref:Uncharacterized protein n=1 Tax=Thelonectria olida TaxID=1576542 RepID=A0A9P8VZL4_9HYPO|nr:hypothetical protein B0T10DRAFT_91863 [Thelonectria olida]
MLRRNSSRNKQRRPLSRSKATNSTTRSPVRLLEAIDPAIAERDARIAAVLSYHRAKSRNSHEMPAMPRDPASFYPDRSDGVPSSGRRSLDRSESTRSQPGGTESASGIKRRQSVRFAGPTAPPRRKLASPASETSHTNPGLRGLGDNRPASTLPYTRPTPDPHGMTRRYIDSLQAPTESYLPEDGIASMPSSYRRLRKSKSMFSTFNPLNPGYYFNNGTPEKDCKQYFGRDAMLHKKENEPLRSDYPPRASTSLSVLKGRRATSRSTSRVENDLAVQLARDTFRQQMQEPIRLKPRSSMFFGSRRKRSESSIGFRKSLRTSSNNSTVVSSAFSTHSISVPKQPGLRKAARKVSQTLRTKLKGLFTRPKSVADSDAQDDLKDAHESDGESDSHLDYGTATQAASVLRVRSHVPSLHAVPSNQELKSRKGSVGSINSTEQQPNENKSRVTSWTNSTTETASCVSELERQQISGIKQTSPNRLSASRAFRQHVLVDEEQVSPFGRTVDSQRVYSALMKRMGKIQQQEVTLSQSINNMTLRGTARAGEAWAASTIRCVRAEDDVFGGCLNRSTPEGHSSSGSSTNTMDKVALARPDPTHDSLQTKPDENLTPPSRPGTEAYLDLSSKLTHRSSAFFASPTCHMFRTTSPYRRALRESMAASEEQDRGDLPGSKYLKSLSEISLPTRQTSSEGSEKDAKTAYAESVYSCLTEDARQPSSRTTAPFETGNVTIFVEPETSFQHRRDVSTASSIEWKTWLSAKVSKLESPGMLPNNKAGRDSSNAAFKLGHVREKAQIDSPDECPRPTRVEADVSPTRKRSSGTVTRAASSKTLIHCDENEAPGGIPHYEWPQNLPPIPPRSQLRTVPSMQNNKSDCGMKTPEMASGALQVRPFNTLGRLEVTPEEAMQKRRMRPHTTGWPRFPAKSSPGPSIAVERQCLSSRTGSPVRRIGLNTSNSTPRFRRAVEGGNDDPEGNQLRGQESDGSLMGSKQMVDMFLDSRRKRTEGDSLGISTESSPVVFL